MKKLAIITTHPIQYNAPLFRMLNERGHVSIKVFYTWGDSVLQNKYDPGFKKHIEWDIPLLDGYDYEFMQNVSNDPGSHHFNGIDNPTLIENVKLWKADAILIFGWAFKSHLKLMRFFKNKLPVFFRGDSTLLDKSPFPKNLIRRILLRWVYRNVHTALYVGTYNKKYFEKMGLKKSQVEWAPHAIDNSRFYDKSGQYETAALQWRHQLGIPKDGFVFLFAGKLEPKKDPFILLKAFNELKLGNAWLIIAGNGLLEKELKEQFVKSENIIFIDFVNQTKMPELYRVGDVFVLPSKGPNETWGLAINEAMACAKPILVSDKCGCSIDLVDTGVNGYVFEAGNELDLKQQMNKIFSENDLLPSYGAKSYEKISEWTYDSICIKLEKLIEKIN